jgi:hypothetical protein
MFAIYCVESKPSFPSNSDITLYQKRHLLIEAAQKDGKESSSPNAGNELLPTNLVLVSTLDGSIRGIDRFEGRVHWTLKGGPGSSLIKSNSHFETHKLYKQGPASVNSKSNIRVEQEEEEEGDKLFLDTLRNVQSDDDNDSVDEEFDEFNLEQQQPWEDSEDVSEHDDDDEDEIYYIIEPQDGGSLYIYGDGRPLEVRKSFFCLFIHFFIMTNFFFCYCCYITRNYLFLLKKL